MSFSHRNIGDRLFKARNAKQWEAYEWKNVNILEAECCPDHIHMLLEIPPKMSVSGFLGYLKGKSSLMLYEQFVDLKFKYRNRAFWCRGFYVDTVGKNTSRVREYIEHQLEEDKMGDQLSIPYSVAFVPSVRYINDIIIAGKICFRCYFWSPLTKFNLTT